MTDCWGCSMLMNAAILNLTKIRKQYVSNMQARRAQEHTNFLVFRNFPFSIFNPFLQGAHLGLKWVWPKVVTNWQICELNKRLSANGSRRGKCSNSAATIASMPRALGSRLQMPKLSLVCILTTTYLHYSSLQFDTEGMVWPVQKEASFDNDQHFEVRES